MESETYVLALVKESERYTFTFASDRTSEVLGIFAKFAGNPELSFSWYDAGELGRKVRQLANV